MTQSGYSLVFGAFLLVGAAICWICGYAAGRISGWKDGWDDGYRIGYRKRDDIAEREKGA